MPGNMYGHVDIFFMVTVDWSTLFFLSTLMLAFFSRVIRSTYQEYSANEKRQSE